MEHVQTAHMLVVTGHVRQHCAHSILVACQLLQPHVGEHANPARGCVRYTLCLRQWASPLMASTHERAIRLCPPD